MTVLVVRPGINPWQPARSQPAVSGTRSLPSRLAAQQRLHLSTGLTSWLATIGHLCLRVLVCGIILLIPWTSVR